ncbi:MAG: hypothetical protein ACYCYO_19395, partial [Bacilli bacterium]
IEGVFACYEYRMIKKRFQRGKKIGARLGHWTNGSAPFPYVYDAEASVFVNRKVDRFANRIVDTTIAYRVETIPTRLPPTVTDRKQNELRSVATVYWMETLHLRSRIQVTTSWMPRGTFHD